MKLTHASLETGFGGFDLAAEQEGYENVFQCEIDPFCQTILKYHFPNADQYGDIRKFNATKYHGKINVLTAGFPCQPFSVAGTQKGVDDERFIWPENFRIIRQCKPDWLILENVAGIFGVSEPTSIAQVENEATFLFHQEKEQETIHERVIKRIIDDLHQAGYILPTDTKGTPIIFVIPACAVNAPHRRDRMFIVANANNDRKGKARNSTTNERCQPSAIYPTRQRRQWQTLLDSRLCNLQRNTTNTNQIGCNGWSSTFRRERDDKSRCRIFGKPKRLCKCPITPNTNRRFSKQPKRKIQTRWQAFINGREWITPNTECKRRREIYDKMESEQPKRFGINSNNKSDVSNSKSKRFSAKYAAKWNAKKGWKTPNRQFEQSTDYDGRTLHTTSWKNFPTEPPLCGGDDGLPSELDNITFPKWRAESIKGYGNAVVVPLVRVLLKTIKQVYQHEKPFSK